MTNVTASKQESTENGFTTKRLQNPNVIKSLEMFTK